MGSSSKELLHMECKNFSSTSPLESMLLVCNEKGSSQTKTPNPDKKPITGPVVQSQVLGKVKDFLGVISNANKQLQQDAKDNSQKYDIEVLTGNEPTVIEMDLMLGIADLHTPDAVAAAESAVAGGQPLIPLDASSSESESEDASDDESEFLNNVGDKGNGGDISNSFSKQKTFKIPNDSFGAPGSGVGSKKRPCPKIVEMS